LPLPDKKGLFIYRKNKMDIMDLLFWFVVVEEEDRYYEES